MSKVSARSSKCNPTPVVKSQRRNGTPFWSIDCAPTGDAITHVASARGTQSLFILSSLVRECAIRRRIGSRIGCRTLYRAHRLEEGRALLDSRGSGAYARVLRVIAWFTLVGSHHEEGDPPHAPHPGQVSIGSRSEDQPRAGRAPVERVRRRLRRRIRHAG